ncbi:hypothetical protein [Fulvivirga ligni]|uniref:hypothetical protein n=1 Tax=Fulvivirga ligni TaxID=2904246 RepID=UPI001F32BD96|nr:hypothetical protein [Fulvivirga ligni]UII21025.1 hypothetical protein LVD16_24585 [Fulvivirga ligni]
MKKILKHSLILSMLTLLILSSCSEDEPGGQDAAVVDIDITMTVVDMDGNDLLDPSNPNAYSESDIDLVFLIDGEEEVYFNANMDAPKGFKIYKNEVGEGYVMRVFPNTAISEDDPVTYIQWGEDDRGTLACEIQRGENFEICTKVWYNGEEKWNVQSSARAFQIVK